MPPRPTQRARSATPASGGGSRFYDDQDAEGSGSIPRSETGSPRRRSQRYANKLSKTHAAAITDDGDVENISTVRSEACSASLDAALRDVTEAVTDINTGRCVKRAWRLLIAHYSLKAGPLNFPLWVRAKLSDNIILACLQAEMGKTVLNDEYTQPKTSLRHKISIIMGLEDQRLVALWFGADPIRTPTRDTLRPLHERLERPDAPNGLTRTAFLEEEYPRMIANWGDRQGYKLDKAKGRVRCTFARLPFADLRAENRARLSIKDFGSQQHEPDVSPPDPEQDDEIRVMIEDGPSMTTEDGTIATCSLEEQNDDSLSNEHVRPTTAKVATPAADVIPSPTPNGPEFAASQTSSLLSISVKSSADFLHDSRPSSAGSDALQLTPWTPWTPLSESALLSASAPVWKRKPDSNQTLDTPSRKRFRFGETPLAVNTASTPFIAQPRDTRHDFHQRHPFMLQQRATSPPSAEVNAPPNLGSSSTPPGSPIPHCPSSETISATASVSLGQKQTPVVVEQIQTTLPNTQDTMIRIIEDDRQWLTGHVINHFLQAARMARRDWGSATLSLRSESDVASIVKMATQNHGQILLCVHRDQCHWVTAKIDLREKTLRAYDSLARESGSSAAILADLQPYLPASDNMKALEGTCPTQSDNSSCGVYALVFALFLLADKPLPASLTIGFWRRLLLAMAKESSLSSVFPAHIVDPAYFDGVPRDADQPLLAPMTGTTPMSRALHLASEAARLTALAHDAAKAGRDWYSPRQQEVASARAWLDTEVVPVIDSLVRLSARTAECLREDIIAIPLEIAMYERVIEDLSKATFADAKTDLVPQVRQKLDVLAGMCRTATKDLVTVTKATELYRRLECEKLREQLELAQGVYEEELGRAASVLGGYGVGVVTE